MFRKLGSCSY